MMLIMNDVKLSKALSWLLRHGASKEGFVLSPEGFIEVEKILQHKSLKVWSVDDIIKCVENNSKKRFSLRKNEFGKLEIKANQGHSIKEVDDSGLNPINDHLQVENVIHGTYYKNWEFIKKDGLKRMNRNHIHFAKGLPKQNVISGMRNNCEILIYIDLKKALEDGIKFYTSENEVILTSGDEDGILKPKYFLKVIDKQTAQNLIANQ